MNVLFRTDASVTIGLGHIMRCLTLADTLRSAGVRCAFVCRDLPGNGIFLLRQSGYEVFVLNAHLQASQSQSPTAARSSQLGRDEDADQTRAAARRFRADWLVVDHYALDIVWERVIATEKLSVMVIDDLADRRHEADVLLDQNLGRVPTDYDELLNGSCQRLISPRYALLRPQFHAQRGASHQRRQDAPLKELLISMGGSDEPNATGAVLRTLAGQPQILQRLQRIQVILGSQAIWREDVEDILRELPVTTELRENVDDMASVMASADLAIGAGGTTSWERCCLGLPSVVFCLADNQARITQSLDEHGAAINLGLLKNNPWQHEFVAAFTRLQANANQLHEMGERAFEITDGLGAARLCHEVFGIKVEWNP